MEAAVSVTVWGEEDQSCSVFILCSRGAVAVLNFQCCSYAEPVSGLHRLLGEARLMYFPAALAVLQAQVLWSGVLM